MAKDITVALELDNKQFNNALKQSQKNVKSFAQDSTTELGGLKSAFAGLVTAATLKSIVDVGASFQDLRNSLNIVFGSVQQGAVQFDRIKTFAAETQFSVQTLTQAFIQLKGAGIEPTEELLRMWSNSLARALDICLFIVIYPLMKESIASMRSSTELTTSTTDNSLLWSNLDIW